MIENEEMGPEIPVQEPVIAECALLLAVINGQLVVIDTNQVSAEDYATTFGNTRAISSEEGCEIVRQINESNEKAELMYSMLPRIDVMIKEAVDTYQKQFVDAIKSLKNVNEENKEIIVPNKKKQ